MINRDILTNIIEKEEGTNWWKPELFKKNILPFLPAELEIIELPPGEENNYNCFVFALGLESDPDFLGGNNPVQQDFIRHLLSKGVLTETRNKLLTKNLVFYENEEGIITHGGILEKKNSVLSKWMWGPKVRHRLWDVPSSFGDRVFYTNKPDSTTVKEEYEIYRDSGVEIQPIL